MTGVTNEAGTAYPSGSPDFITIFSEAGTSGSLDFITIFSEAGTALPFRISWLHHGVTNEVVTTLPFRISWLHYNI